MRLSVGIPSYASQEYAIPGSRFERYVRLAEEYGFGGAWTIEHLVQPPTYATSFLDPLTTLATVGGATEALDLGTSILILPMREPVLVAKRAATIQHLCDRRITLGLGAGYVEEEFSAVNVPREERSSRYLEGIELISRLFREDRVTFDGEHFSVEDFRLEPRPTQSPRILAGGGGVDRDGERVVSRGVKRRLAHADGWIAAPMAMETLRADWNELAAHLESEGRDPDAVDRVGLQYLHFVPTDDPDRAKAKQRKVYGGLVGPERSVEHAEEGWLFGDEERVREQIASYEREGFDELILHPVARVPSELDRQLELWRNRLLSEYR